MSGGARLEAVNGGRHPATIRSRPVSEFFAVAEAIADSDGVMRAAYAACEFDCLDDDGKVWIAAIVREAMARAAEIRS